MIECESRGIAGTWRADAGSLAGRTSFANRRAAMRLMIEIAAAALLVFCISATSAAFAAGKAGKSADGLSCSFSAANRRFARRALCRDQAAMRRKILRQLLRRQAAVGDVRSSAALVCLRPGRRPGSTGSRSFVRCAVLCEPRVAQVDLLQQLRSAGRKISRRGRRKAWPDLRCRGWRRWHSLDRWRRLHPARASESGWLVSAFIVSIPCSTSAPEATSNR